MILKTMNFFNKNALPLDEGSAYLLIKVFSIKAAKFNQTILNLFQNHFLQTKDELKKVTCLVPSDN